MKAGELKKETGPDAITENKCNQGQNLQKGRNPKCRLCEQIEKTVCRMFAAAQSLRKKNTKGADRVKLNAVTEKGSQ